MQGYGLADEAVAPKWSNPASAFIGSVGLAPLSVLERLSSLEREISVLREEMVKRDSSLDQRLTSLEQLVRG